MKQIANQITIKLNKERFQKILKDMVSITGTVATNSEMVGKALWFLYCWGFKKIPAFGNKTHMEMMMQARKMTREEFIIDCQKKYQKFVETYKPF